MGDFLDWIWCILKNFWKFIVENFFELIDIIGEFALQLLPDSPFIFEPVEWGNFGNLIGFFIPIQKMIIHFTSILSAILLYYGVRHLLRLIKQVG